MSRSRWRKSAAPADCWRLRIPVGAHNRDCRHKPIAQTHRARGASNSHACSEGGRLLSRGDDSASSRAGESTRGYHVSVRGDGRLTKVQGPRLHAPSKHGKQRDVLVCRRIGDTPSARFKARIEREIKKFSNKKVL